MRINISSSFLLRVALSNKLMCTYIILYHGLKIRICTGEIPMKKEVRRTLSEIVEKLKIEYKPQKIILFGSYAYGNPREDSDLDLLILKNTNSRRVDRYVRVKKIIYNPNRRITISPLVLTPKELAHRLRMGDDFIKEIIQKGVVLYEGRAG